MNKILAAIGKFAKGKLTVVGGVLSALGLGIGGGDQLGECAAKLVEHPDGAVATAGALLFLLGVARKAGWAGAKATGG